MNRVHALLPWMLCTAALLGTTVVRADDTKHDYPTGERVQFVEECINDYPDKGRFELIQKCSCVIDMFAKHYSYDDFVDMSTAAKASTISGERGNVVRDSPVGKELNAAYKKALSSAKEACFLQ